MSQQSIIKILTSSGAGSRRQMADAVKNHRVAVNGEIVESFKHPVDTDTDRITIDGKPLRIQPEQLLYLMLHKPAGVTSTTSDEKAESTVLDMVPKKYRGARLYPVGRLDKDSTGLILLTNDGDLTFHLTHPRFESEKEYLVGIEGSLKPEEKRKLEKGVEMEEDQTHAARVRSVNIPPYNYSIVIHEGRKRQIRRMFAALGYMVTNLKRVRLGSLKLGTLAEGQVRELTPAELKSLKR
ncbi:MAG: pseudouridine synthase [Dehalococcoidales bacterium]|nr:pseudouridine synthase [Dehalococcoidales bacterium]